MIQAYFGLKRPPFSKELKTGQTMGIDPSAPDACEKKKIADRQMK